MKILFSITTSSTAIVTVPPQLRDAFEAILFPPLRDGFNVDPADKLDDIIEEVIDGDEKVVGENEESGLASWLTLVQASTGSPDAYLFV